MTSFEALPEILTPKQVADYLRLSEESVYRYIREGRLVALKFGRSYRINKADLAEFIRASRTDTPPP